MSYAGPSSGNRERNSWASAIWVGLNGYQPWTAVPGEGRGLIRPVETDVYWLLALAVGGDRLPWQDALKPQHLRARGA
jgi:hypothetical protein